MIDEEFICFNCNKKVLPLKYTARDHCPYCLFSRHVDINPGDRLAKCNGALHPIGIEQGKKGYKIVYRCAKCNAIRKNVVAKDDDIDIIILLSKNPIV